MALDQINSNGINSVGSAAGVQQQLAQGAFQGAIDSQKQIVNTLLNNDNDKNNQNQSPQKVLQNQIQGGQRIDVKV